MEGADRQVLENTAEQHHLANGAYRKTGIAHVDAPLSWSLEDVEREVWAMLFRAKRDRRHAFHTPTFVTHGLDGFPQARTVVLRGVNAGEKYLQFHTDVRSAKIQEIEANPLVAWHFYDAQSKVQVRLTARAEIYRRDDNRKRQGTEHTSTHGHKHALEEANSKNDKAEDVWQEAWSATPVMSRRCYLAPIAPGTEIPNASPNLPDELIERIPTEEESIAGAQNFAVIRTHVLSLEWLYLRALGHMKARCTYDSRGHIIATSWLAP